MKNNETISELLKKKPEFLHFREVIEMIPLIQQKSLESIYKEIVYNFHNNERMAEERERIRNISEIINSKWSTDIIYLILIKKILILMIF